MSKFEDLFDDFMIKAKSVAGSASKKTGEVVDISKVRYQVKQTQWDLEKTYAKLGALVYESKKSDESFEEVIDLAISEIDALQEKLEELALRLREHKKVSRCPDCGKENDQSFAFCSRCGGPLEVEEEVEPMEVEIVEPEEDAGVMEAPATSDED